MTAAAWAVPRRGKYRQGATGYGDDQGCSGGGGRVVYDGIARRKQLAARFGGCAGEGRTRDPPAELRAVGGCAFAESALDDNDRPRGAEQYEPVFRGAGARHRGW